jgi:hypothetical protein
MILPEFYTTCLAKYLSPSQLLTLEILTWLLQVHKQVRIERLAACLPIPILYESRRRHLQRFLLLRKLSVPLVWFPIIKCILNSQGWEFCQGWVEQLMQLSRNKLPYFQRGLRAREEIQAIN